MRRMWNILGSLKLTVWLLALSMVLVFAGTLAQVDHGLWTVVDQYFRTIVAWIDLSIFFPRGASVPDWRIPFPGGFLLGALLTINLLVVHVGRFEVVAVGRRRWLGWGVLLAGILLCVIIVLGGGHEPVAATAGDAFWRVFLRLGRGLLVATLLYSGCQLLYRNKAGLVLSHAGILFLLIGEFFTALFAVESSMTIGNGETVAFADHKKRVELSFTDSSHSEYDEVTVIPQRLLKSGAEIDAEALPFTVRVVQMIPDTAQPQSLRSAQATPPADWPDYAGVGATTYLLPDMDSKQVVPAVDIELVNKQDGQVLGRYICSLWFDPNYVGRVWDAPQQVRVGDRSYTFYLRPKREYLVSSSGNPFALELLQFTHETYEGTQMPRHFASDIRLVNKGDQVDRILKIWMNNPLRYARRTFYQAGYLPDGGTVLQVVRNDGWMIPYISCSIVMLGMAGHFVQRRNVSGNSGCAV